MMKRIEKIENALENKVTFQETGLNRTFIEAYTYSLVAGNDLMNYGEVIWERDIEEIVANCKECGIREFTISSTFSSLIPTLAAFEKAGCKMVGLTEINSRHDDWNARREGIRVKERIPAIKMSL